MKSGEEEGEGGRRKLENNKNKNGFFLCGWEGGEDIFRMLIFFFNFCFFFNFQINWIRRYQKLQRRKRWVLAKPYNPAYWASIKRRSPSRNL
jgi:hypothetical protein